MAISITVTATKIDVTSTGGVLVTMSDIVAQIADITVMEKVGDIITIKRAAGQIYREFEISSGCKIDFESGKTYNFEGITNSGSYIQLDVAYDSYIKIGENTHFDFNSDSQTYSRGYQYFSGEVDAEASLGNEIIMEHYRNIYITPRNDQYWDYIILKNNMYSSGYFLSFVSPAYTTEIPTVSFKHITVTNDNGNYYGSAIYANISGIPLVNYIFEDWNISHIAYPLYVYHFSATLKRFNISDTTIQGILYSVGNLSGTPTQSTNVAKYAIGSTYQNYLIFDDCTFDDLDNGIYNFTCYYPGTTVFKNCSFNNQTYGVYVAYSGIARFVGTNTFTNISTSDKRYTYGGSTLDSFEIGITIQDEDGNPIENVSVSITQDDEYEHFERLSNSNGEVLSDFGYKTFLTNKAYYAVSSYEDWSAHTVSVVKDGYNKSITSLTVDADKDIIITLIAENEQATTLNGCTINDAVIY